MCVKECHTLKYVENTFIVTFSCRPKLYYKEAQLYKVILSSIISLSYFVESLFASVAVFLLHLFILFGVGLPAYFSNHCKLSRELCAQTLDLLC